METQARYDQRPDRTAPARGGAAGFTLIELLTVVAIIGLLVGMVVPTISSVLDALYAARTLSRIDNLANGARMYKVEGSGNKYFPAQQYAKNILETGSTIGTGGSLANGRAAPASYTNAGSALLGRILFTKTDPNATNSNALPDLFPVGNWSVLDTDMLDPPDVTTSTIGRDTPRPYSIVDCSSHPLAILYFVSRLEKMGTRTPALQYTVNDNAVYIPDNTYRGARNDKGDLWDIQWFVIGGTIDPTVQPGVNDPTPVIKMDGQFVLIAAGKATSTGSRKYFDSTTGLSNVPR